MYQRKHYFWKMNLILNSFTKTKKLPNTCSTPKFYKSPTKWRIIIISPNCPVKPFLKVVIVAIALMYTQTENHNFKTQYYSCVKIFSSIQNNEKVINTISNKLNARNKAISFDFPFYMQISHTTSWTGDGRVD